MNPENELVSKLAPYPGSAEDVNEAERLGITVSQLQSQRKFDALAKKVLGPVEEDPDLKRAREALAKKEAEVAKIESERREAAQQWAIFRKKDEDIAKRQQQGGYIVACAEQSKADYEHTINLILNGRHPVPHFNEYPNGALDLGKMLAGAKEVLALAPAWREALAAEKDANDKAREAFAKKHGIDSDAPGEPTLEKHSVRGECLEVRVASEMAPARSAAA